MGIETMGIEWLIEEIAERSDNIYARVTKRRYKLVEEPGNNHLAVEAETEGYYGKDDLVVALANADLFGWELRSVDRECVCGSDFLVKYEITLWKMN